MHDKFCESPAEDSDSVKFVDTLSKLMKLNCHQPKILKEYEASYSAIFFQALDRYLFLNESPKGCVLHQPALLEDKTHCNVPDGYVVKLRDGLHSHPMLISDYKKSLVKPLNGKVSVSYHNLS